jgi:hypothetical protein
MMDDLTVEEVEALTFKQLIELTQKRLKAEVQI